jgi:hypothetical protein
MIEKEDGDLLIRSFTDIDATMDLFGGLIPIHLPGRDLEALNLTHIAIFESEGLSMQNDSNTVKRVTVPGHGLAGCKLHAADKCCSTPEEDFILHVVLLWASGYQPLL